jgi:transcriptional regulator with XRE-family HTH domain
MDKTKERFREMLNDIAERYGIKTFKQLAEMSGISQNTFTRIKRNEVKEVDIETFRKLNAAFDNRYNVLWFQGDSPYMMMEEYLAANKSQLPLPDYTSLLNAALAAKDETIASYQKQLQVTEKRLEDKDATIETLRAQIADKDDHIATLKARVAELRRIIDANNLMDAAYPFPVGTADGNKQQSKRK